MGTRYPVRRPTEDTALHAASRTSRPLPPAHVLLAALVTAYAMGDRHGMQLFALAVVRTAGGPTR
ncbi:hypothetical protein [Streptomyces sp. NPDC053079]|uniref:hypothetical protein n=1 Tax=Streptomyces sp. NPDC053079 TaxID=3365697 RepID=UPI0037CDB8B0